jgi:hypothetical protein
MALIYWKFCIHQLSSVISNTVVKDKRSHSGKEGKGRTYILRISGESMIDTRRQNYEITLLHGDANPVVLNATDIKIAISIEDIPNLLVLMQVLVKEHLHLILVNGAHRLRRHDALIAVLVVSFLRELVDRRNLGVVPVKNADRGKMGFVDGTAGVVQLSLVTLGFDCE